MHSLQVLHLIPLFFSLTAASVIDLDIAIQNGYSLVTTELGTPAKSYKLLFDTGSSTTWVVDKNCAEQTCTNGSGFNRTGYDESASSTGEDLNAFSTIDYVGGAVEGWAYSDVMTAAGTSFRHSFLAVTKSNWVGLAADGFLGLASSTIAATNTTSVFEDLMQQGLADEPVFAIYQGRSVNNWTVPSPSDNNGVLTLGGSKHSVYASEEPRYVTALTPFEVYKLPLVNVTMTNTAASPDTPSTFTWNSQVVFDTGASAITVPNGYISEMYDMTPWSYSDLMSGMRPLCSEFNDTWSFTLNLGTADAQQSFTVTGDQLRSPGYQDDEHCFPPFDSWDYDNMIVGKKWMRNWYTIFDFGSTDPASYDLKLGFAPLKEEYKPKYSE